MLLYLNKGVAGSVGATVSVPATLFITSQRDVFRIWGGHLPPDKLTEVAEQLLAMEALGAHDLEPREFRM